MIRSCHELPDNEVITADVCIIGGGPAGLTIASALDGAPLRVVVLEAGGQPANRPAGLSELSADVGDGDLAPPLRVPPRLGGAANEWNVRLANRQRGVRMLPLSPSDLESRSWVPDSGWPIAWNELNRYYGRADEFLGLTDRGYGVDQWEDDRGKRLDLEEHGFTTKMEQFASPAVFTRSIRKRLEASSNVAVYLDGAAGLIDGAPDRATHVMIDHGRAGRLRVEAGVFVLASGGIDNATMLLRARDGMGFAGSQDVVGRYYLDHQRVVTGLVTPTDKSLFQNGSLYDLTTRDGVGAMGKLAPTEDLLATHRMLHSGSMLLPKPPADIQSALAAPLRRPSPITLARTAGYVARIGAEMAIRQRRWRPRVDAGWSTLGGSAFDRFCVETQVELAPDRNNCVRLGDSVDEFGRKRPEMSWRWNEIDLQSLRATTLLLEKAFSNSGLGVFEPDPWNDRPLLTTPNGAFHPSGTTRMGDNRATSVTDRNAKLHGVTNVYVSGSSLFPTVGYANPTLTIVALGLRLADHLRPSSIVHKRSMAPQQEQPQTRRRPVLQAFDELVTRHGSI